MPPTTSPIDLGAAFEAAVVTPQQWIEVEVQLEAMRESFDPARPITPRLRSVTVTRNCPALS
jgi:hypothetical protein